MESNIWKINKGDTDLRPLLDEADKVAKYNNLKGKKALCLRLLTEELVSMLPSIVENYSGEFQIVNDSDYYEIRVKFFVNDMTASTRQHLIEVSKSNKNSSVVGITGRIREAFDYMAVESDDPIISISGSGPHKAYAASPILIRE